MTSASANVPKRPYTTQSGCATVALMASTAANADAFWADAVARGWAVGDTEVLSDDDLLELACGLGPPLIGQRGPEAVVTTVFMRPGTGEETAGPFHSEEGVDGEDVGWVVLHCTEVDGLVGGETTLAQFDALLDALTPEERSLAAEAEGTLQRFGLTRPWRLLRDDGSIDLPSAFVYAEPGAHGSSVLVIPDARHRSLFEHMQHVAQQVADVIDWKQGRVLVFDNRRMVHGRRAVSAGRRTLKRVLCGVDEDGPR